MAELTGEALSGVVIVIKYMRQELETTLLHFDCCSDFLLPIVIVRKRLIFCRVVNIQLPCIPSVAEGQL